MKNDAKHARCLPFAARSYARKTWVSGGSTVSVEPIADTADGDYPWLTSCDTHGQMMTSSTRANAISAARHRDWCSGCAAKESTR